MAVKKGVKELVAAAEADIETMSAADAKAAQEGGNATIVDLRDVRELWREGKIRGAVHAPRGMLEFWVDPASPYHRDVFASGGKFIFYCQSGWRSALATKAVQDMGLEPVAHIGGGFTAWVEAGLPTEEVKPKERK
ncbi:MAG: rhodanese-like domain-containing protein [Proteobacteria bacterium]|nr:rhodanese-like domain-containing protein [Pseudomonadota bacterium]MCH8187805.1 rhodanese-like domain-containing protein [Pseudomonadota bacterium]